jgi:hypothetical protein
VKNLALWFVFFVILSKAKNLKYYFWRNNARFFASSE